MKSTVWIIIAILFTAFTLFFACTFFYKNTFEGYSDLALIESTDPSNDITKDIDSIDDSLLNDIDIAYIDPSGNSYNNVSITTTDTSINLDDVITDDSYIDNNDTNDSDIQFDSNNYDVQYHETPEELAVDDPSIVIDASGNLFTQSVSSPQGKVTYYEPGSYIYGASTYVPNYQDSVYLSTLPNKSTNESNTTSPNYFNFNKNFLNYEKILDGSNNYIANDKILNIWPNDK
jgi:hypothetical protein